MEKVAELREIVEELYKLASEVPEPVELDAEKVRDFLLFYGSRNNASK